MKMKRRTRIVLAAIILSIGGCIGYGYYRITRPYVPSAELAEAYDRLFQAEKADSAAAKGDGGIGYYDIEKTVRIMNSLEVAQARSNSFDELLLHMARQDYSGVAKEVLAAKKRMFPILEEMNALRKQLDDASSVMGYLRCVSVQAEAPANRTNDLATTLLALAATQGRSALDAAFEAFREQQHLKKEIAGKLAKINREYIRYVEAYAPIYHKYMKEWDALCRLKDQAYIDLYSGQYADALNNAEQVLALSPGNEEGLLLKACALIESGPGEAPGRIPATDAAANLRALQPAEAAHGTGSLADPHYFTAERTLDEYLRLYPGKAAPALLLKGVLYRRIGDRDKAMVHFEQAAVEYPRQAEALTDLLDSYRNRAYLSRSAEGLYLLNYYRSTMEGFGLFSPNFQKAALLASENRIDESRQEIYRHFFRRSQQSVRHCLLSDLQYCETHLLSSFRPLFLESNYIDLAYAPCSRFLGMGKKRDKIDVKFVNRSDLRLENVRLFLCIHCTGMYTDDYEVIKVPVEKNIVEPYTEVDFEAVDIAPRTIDRITRIRGVVITDDRIGWIDTPEFKRERVTATPERLPAIEQAEIARRNSYLADFDLDAPKIKQLVARNMRINDRPVKSRWNRNPETREAETGAGRKTDSFTGNISQAVGRFFGDGRTGKLRIELPRVLALFDPFFTIHAAGESDKVRYPECNMLTGEFIRIEFDLAPEEGEIVPLYLYGNSIRLRTEIAKTSDGFEIVSIEEV